MLLRAATQIGCMPSQAELPASGRYIRRFHRGFRCTPSAPTQQSPTQFGCCQTSSSPSISNAIGHHTGDASTRRDRARQACIQSFFPPASMSLLVAGHRAGKNAPNATNAFRPRVHIRPRRPRARSARARPQYQHCFVRRHRRLIVRQLPVAEELPAASPGCCPQLNSEAPVLRLTIPANSAHKSP